MSDRQRYTTSRNGRELIDNAREGIAFAGDRKMFPEDLQAGFCLRKDADACGTGLLGFCAARWNQWVDPLRLSPRYLKASAAEEKVGR